VLQSSRIGDKGRMVKHKNKGLVFIPFFLMMAWPAEAGLATQAPAAQESPWRANHDAGKKAFDAHRLGEAEKFYSAGLAQAEKFGEKDLRLAVSLFDMGIIYYVQQRYEKAEKVLKRAITIREDVPGPDEPELNRVLLQLGEVYRAERRLDEAQSLYDHVLEMSEVQTTEGQLVTGTVYFDMAQVSAELQNFARAETLYFIALPLFQKAEGANSLAAGETFLNLGQLYQAKSAYADSEKNYLEAIAVFEKGGELENARLAEALESYANLLREMNRKDDASRAEKRAREVRRHKAN
jgi:tetratricopeptide (TPR) repeat protein